MRHVVSRPSAMAFLLLQPAGPAVAHDIWLAAERAVLQPGETLVVRQLVGADLEVEQELPLLRRMTPRFQVITGAGTVDVLAGLPAEREQPVVQPVLEHPLDSAGLVLVTMEHAFLHTEHSAEKFREYLEHEELDLELFREPLRRGTPQRERYSRTLKCLVQVGDTAGNTAGNTPGADLHDRQVGQALEILLLQDPFRLAPGSELAARVLFAGKPLAGHLVTAMRGDGEGPTTTSKAHTDDDGVVRFRLDGQGLWLIRLVRLVPSSESDVDWDSYWSAYSFRLD